MGYPKKERIREAGLEGLSNTEYRNRLIATAIADADTREEKQRLIEQAPKLPKRRKVKLDYQNQLQRESRGRMLRFLREKLGLTQIEFSMLVGTNRSYVGQVERGVIDISCAAMDMWVSRCGGRLMIVPF
jgi:DNA-binding transcriptional regulator YiaG